MLEDQSPAIDIRRLGETPVDDPVKELPTVVFITGSQPYPIRAH